MIPRALVISLLLTSTANAQSTPPPSGTLPPPLTGYVGRYLDSVQSPDVSIGHTLNTSSIKVNPERDLILIRLGGSFLGAYRMSTFAQRISVGQRSTGAKGEKYLAPDAFSVDPQRPGSGWIITPNNFPNLSAFDWDDRGYLYLAYSGWGFGIVDTNGVKQSQVNPAAVAPLNIFTVRDGANVRAVVTDTFSGTAVYDVTDPTAPLFLRRLPLAITGYVRLASGGVAVQTWGCPACATVGREIRIYANGGDLAAGRSPVQISTTQAGLIYVAGVMATDGTAVFALQEVSSGPFSQFLSVLTPSAAGYVERHYPPIVGLGPVDLQYGAGFIVIAGFTFPIQDWRTVVFYTRDSSIASNLTPYFRAAYLPEQVMARSIAPYTSGGQSYVIAGMWGVGELFTIASPQSPVIVPALPPVALLALIVALATTALLRLR